MGSVFSGVPRTNLTSVKKKKKKASGTVDEAEAMGMSPPGISVCGLEHLSYSSEWYKLYLGIWSLSELWRRDFRMKMMRGWLTIWELGEQNSGGQGSPAFIHSPVYSSASELVRT